eukprot:CAMPEP_0194118014 /NCGR_PEP_ID=MMETSP0150-20130528/33767_1 /TAXON_ID=122233 /ORGANISM="Chaetoceros debilis, Strain MM31A-1" /LENGTH=81 /DNA_ID=CAMNT_0038809239 /DNA_START=61 /DNA_END=306 /DNA_ORIENTATION=+
MLVRLLQQLPLEQYYLVHLGWGEERERVFLLFDLDDNLEDNLDCERECLFVSLLDFYLGDNLDDHFLLDDNLDKNLDSWWS